MANDTLLKKLMGINPHFEMIIRRVYRLSPLTSLLTKNKKNKKNVINKSIIDFKKILAYLSSVGVKKGDIVIVHSAYGALKSTNLSPDQIVDSLISLVGTSGTLCMPVIRKFPESPKDEEVLSTSIEKIVFTYNVQKSEIWTGIISKTLMLRKESHTSRFPLNTLTAIGPHAEPMMRHNLVDELPTPNGIYSPWKYCTDKNAWVISLGTDLTHSLTMIHTAEDVKKTNWPVKNWYRQKKFKIIDNDFSCEKVVLERHPKWGMLHFGERKLSKDLVNNGIMKTNIIDGVLIESLRSRALYEFLNAKNKKGYPYYWVNKQLKKI